MRPMIWRHTREVRCSICSGCRPGAARVVGSFSATACRLEAGGVRLVCTPAGEDPSSCRTLWIRAQEEDT